MKNSKKNRIYYWNISTNEIFCINEVAEIKQISTFHVEILGARIYAMAHKWWQMYFRLFGIYIHMLGLSVVFMSVACWPHVLWMSLNWVEIIPLLNIPQGKIYPYEAFGVFRFVFLLSLKITQVKEPKMEWNKMWWNCIRIFDFWIRVGVKQTTHIHTYGRKHTHINKY